MMIYFVRILMALLVFAFVACNNQNTETAISKSDKTAAANTEIPKGKALPNMLVISAMSYRGITPGSEIATHKAYTEKSIIKTGEGTFEVYKIKDYKDGFVGYFLPNPQDETRVGDIVVDVAAAKTLQGIRVGDSFQKLRETVPGLAVHGSEIESRTYAQKERHAYRLDVANSSYEVDINSIPPATKITEIRITR